MNHGVLSLEGPQPVAAVGHAAAQEAYPVAEAAIKRGGPLGVLAVNLGRQAVEHGDFVSLIGELERDVRADEARAARDQNVFHNYRLVFEGRLSF